LQAEELPQPNTMGAAAMDAPLSLHTIVVAASEQVSCPLGEESAILNLKNSVYYGMNPVGARVWNLLKQPTSITELRDVLLEEYEVDATRCGDDLLALLETMRREGLIEVRGVAASA
jgi:Coenzyme PQQ synthesis protein D (PqqD)